MQIKLFKKPKNVTIVTGFPGFGLVGTIATEFLLDHLHTEQIGKIWMNELPAMIAVHEGRLVEPLGIFYHKEKNLVIVHGVTAVKGLEWKIADAVMKIAEELAAHEILCLEGVGSLQQKKDPDIFYFANNKETKSMLKKADCKDLNEGIIMGVTGSILIRADKLDKACIFAETHSNLPDSNAAAKVVQVLDKYLGLKVDYKPLIEQASKFEEKLKGMMQRGQEAEKMQQMKNLSYMG